MAAATAPASSPATATAASPAERSGVAAAQPKDWKVVNLFAEFDLAKFSAFPPSFRRSVQSLSLFPVSPSQTLVYVGTDGGNIVLLSANPSSPASHPGHDSDSKSIEFLRYASVSDSPVVSIHVFPEIERVLTVSDGFLYLIDAHLLLPARKLRYPTGVSAVAKRVAGGDGWDWLQNGGSGVESSARHNFLQKISGRAKGAAATSNSRAFTGRAGGNPIVVAVAASKKLVLMELDVSGADSNGGEGVVLKEIQASDGVKAIAWLEDSVIVGTKDGYVMFSCSSGQCTPLFLLPESANPCLKPLWRHKEAVLLVDNLAIITNPLGQPVGGSLVFLNAPDCVGEIGSHVVALRGEKMDVYHKKTGVCVQSMSFDGPRMGRSIIVDEESGRGDILVVATASKAFCLKKVPPDEQIKDLLRKKYYEEAIYLVEELETEGELTKEMLSFVHAQVGFLLLFDLQFEEAVNHFLLSETMRPSEIFPFIVQDPNRWSQVVPRNRYWGLHPPPVLIEEVVDNGLMAIQRAMFLRKAGVDTGEDRVYLLDPPTRADLLESAIQSLIRYMTFSRNKDFDPLVNEGVDTLLMHLYRALNQEDKMEQLASSPSYCVVEELETSLQDSGHLRTLAYLYANKGPRSKALGIWKILSRSYSAGLRKDVGDSLLESIDVISSQRTAAKEASSILELSSDEELVLQHLGWIADIDQDIAVRILTSGMRANQLSPGKVIATIDPKKVEILQRYLQWLIEEQESGDCQFHTIYAVSLAKSALEVVEMDSMSQTSTDGLEAGGASEREDGRSSGLSIRERLQLFLHSSDLYDPEEVLYLIERSELWIEKAILYRKLGQETLVLQILALKLGDYEAAEEYCTEIGRADAYMQLLDMYLDPQNGKQPMFKAAVRLLHKHGECLDPLQVLESLSPDMSLQLASDTIIRILKARNHHHRQGQIANNLSRAVNLEAKLVRLEERSRHVHINDESLCDSCHARLGTKLFAMYPDDSVVCYKCFRRRGESLANGYNGKLGALVFKPGWLVNKS